MTNLRQAITSLIVGEAYTSWWSRYMLPGWAYYCAKHGLDLVVYLEPLDRTERAKGRKLNWQKCLILSQPEIQNFDQVAWIDADVAINAVYSPSIFKRCPVELIGGVGLDAFPTQPHVVTSGGQLTVDELERSFSQNTVQQLVVAPSGDGLTIEDAQESVQRLYTANGVDFEVKGSINTGVMVLSPKHHTALLELIYETYEDVYAPISDQFAIPVEAYRQNLIFNIDSRFNVQVNGEIASKYPFLMFTGKEINELTFLCLQSSFCASYFLHFAAAQQRMKFFQPLFYGWRDFCRIGANFLPSMNIKTEDFDPASISSSYFGCLDELRQVVPVDPKLGGRVFERKFKKFNCIFSASILSHSTLFRFHEAEFVRSLERSYRWVDGRRARAKFQVSVIESLPIFVKYEIDVHFYDDGSPWSLGNILAASFFLNGYPSIERTLASFDSEKPSPKLTSVRYTGFCWLTSDEQRLEVVAPNRTAYGQSINNDPRTLSVAIFDVDLKLYTSN